MKGQRTLQPARSSIRKMFEAMEKAQKDRTSWLHRLLERPDAEVDVLVVTVACDGLSQVAANEGDEAAEHIRRIMVRLLRESDPLAEIDASGDEFTFVVPAKDFDPNFWAIRMENSFRRAISDAGYAVSVDFQLSGSEVDRLRNTPEPAFYLN